MSTERSTASAFESVLTDLRYALRQIPRSPGFALVATLSLAIGIGANVTIFSAANAFLRRPADAVRPDELVRVYRGAHSPLPRDWFLHLAANARTATAFIAEDPLATSVDVDGTSERVMASVVSENFFAELGVEAAVGTPFRGAPGEEIGQVAVLEHGFWQSRFGGDRRVIGRTVRINDHPYLIVAVAREGFRSSQFGWAPQVFVPFSELPRLRGTPASRQETRSTYVMGRLAPGASPAQLADEIRSLAPGLPRSDSLAQRPGAFNVEVARGITAEARQPAAVVSAFLLALVGLVLLIACLNLGNLLLARATSRRREIAIRTALGVTRARLVRQLLTESTVLTVLGGVGGVAIAWYATRLAPSLLPADAPVAFDITPNLTVLGFALVLSVGTGLVFGLVPALRASRSDVATLLRSSGSAGEGRSRLRSAFLGGQVALALTLLIVAALFLRGLGAAQQIDPGFNSERVVNVNLDLSLRAYDAARGATFHATALERVRALRNVEGASIVGTPPLVASNSGTSVLPPEAAFDDRQASRGTTFTSVSDGYFQLMQIPFIAGRPIDERDRAGTERVAVVNESFARMLWGADPALGKQFRVFREEALITVVGVTPDVKYKSLNDDGEPFVYFPMSQSFQQSGVLQARLRSDSPAARAELIAAVQTADPGLPLGQAQSALDAMAVSLLPARIGAILLGAFGGIALLLATLGVYGVTAYVVGQRTAEIGIRTALGAPASAVLRMLMGETLRVVGVGAVIGLAGGAAIGALVSSSLYGISGFDPVAFAGASGVLIVVAVLGTLVPARRALRVDPMQAVRAE